jgi:hypothetical protein
MPVVVSAATIAFDALMSKFQTACATMSCAAPAKTRADVRAGYVLRCLRPKTIECWQLVGREVSVAGPACAAVGKVEANLLGQQRILFQARHHNDV